MFGIIWGFIQFILWALIAYFIFEYLRRTKILKKTFPMIEGEIWDFLAAIIIAAIIVQFLPLIIAIIVFLFVIGLFLSMFRCRGIGRFCHSIKV